MMTANRRTSDRRRNGAMIALVVAVGCLCVVLLVGFVEDRHLRAHDGKQTATATDLRDAQIRLCHLVVDRVGSHFDDQAVNGARVTAAVAKWDKRFADASKGAAKARYLLEAQTLLAGSARFSLLPALDCEAFVRNPRTYRIPPSVPVR